MKIFVMGLPGSGKTYLTKRFNHYSKQLGITLIKSERWLMIGIFQMKEEKDNQIE